MTSMSKLLSSLSLAIALAAFSAPAAASTFAAVQTDRSAKVLLTRLAATEGRTLVWQLPRDYKIGSAEQFNKASGISDAATVDEAVAKVLALLRKNRPEEPAAYACKGARTGATASIVVRRGACPAA
jgi:hypothetical protein